MNLTLAICSIQEEKEDTLICVSATHVSLICTQKRWRRLWKVSYYEKFIAAHPINLPFSDCATLHKTS